MSEYYERSKLMRRCNSPFNGKQFVLNKNTGEIHDLDHETPQCQIDEIKPEHVFNCDTYTEAVILLPCSL